MKRLLYVLPAVLIASALFIASHQPNLKVPEFDFTFGDKILHFVAYLVFGLTICFALKQNMPEKNKSLIFFILILIGALYGFSDEYHQSFIPGRTADVFDWLADVTGVTASWPVFLNLLKVKFFKTLLKI